MARIFDIVLVGAGPCGLAAAADFSRAGVSYVHLEKGSLAQTIRHFPRKITLYSPRQLLAFGGLPFPSNPEQPPTREEYLKYLRESTRALGLKVKTRREAREVRLGKEAHCIATQTGEEYFGRNLVVATGGYYAPVPLEIPGEDLPTVAHYFRSDLPCRGQRVLVVGGRNSAVEACVILARKGAEVILSYRRSRLPRRQIKPWLLPDFDKWMEKGRVKPRLCTVPVEIGSGEALLAHTSGEKETLRCDRVFLLTGYGPDYDLLKRMGVPLHPRTHRPLFNPHTLETRIPGVFLCGTVVLTWRGEKANIENSRDHGRIILENLRQG